LLIVDPGIVDKALLTSASPKTCNKNSKNAQRRQGAVRAHNALTAYLPKAVVSSSNFWE
jgi:hypothetical protein